jgi:hypothetical protein
MAWCVIRKADEEIAALPVESHEGEEEHWAGTVHQGQKEHADEQAHRPDWGELSNRGKYRYRYRIEIYWNFELDVIILNERWMKTTSAHRAGTAGTGISDVLTLKKDRLCKV